MFLPIPISALFYFLFFFYFVIRPLKDHPASRTHLPPQKLVESTKPLKAIWPYSRGHAKEYVSPSVSCSIFKCVCVCACGGLLCVLVLFTSYYQGKQKFYYLFMSTPESQCRSQLAVRNPWQTKSRGPADRGLGLCGGRAQRVNYA